MNSFLSSHLLEISATISGLLNVYLAARANIWNWFFGIITVCLYLVIFLHVKLYADMGLQVVFLGMQFYGLHQWLYGGAQQSVLNIRQVTYPIVFIAFFAILGLFGFLVYILQNFTDSTMVYADAFITAMSLVAQWMMSKKWLEHWWLWIIVDIFSILVYFNKSLYFTMGLYAILLGLCVLGYSQWKKQLNVA